MLINLSELFSVDGKEKSYTPEIEMETFRGPVGEYPILSGGPVKLRIRNLGARRLLLEGTAKMTLSIPCDRCLEPVECPFELELTEELDMNLTDEERAAKLEEQPYISGYYLDVDQLLGSELLLNMPMKVLCREDCLGICNRCGMNLNHGTCSCDQSSPDPRMSVIQDLFQQFKEV